MTELATAGQIARALGVAPRTVHGWVQRREDFPAPIAKLPVGRVWDLAVVREWHDTADLSHSYRRIR